MGFSPYSQTVTPAAYVAPIDPSLLLQGATYTQALQEKNLKEIEDVPAMFASIPAYGPDKQAIREIQDNFQKDVQNVSYGDLKSPQTMSQIRGLIKSYASNPDLLAIAQRGHTYDQMRAEKAEFEKKGKAYVNPGLDSLGEYFSGKDYVKDLNFSNKPIVPPDIGKLMKEAKEVTGVSERQVYDPTTKSYQTIKYTDPAKLQENIKAIALQDPNYEALAKYNFDKKYKDVDWDQHGNDILNGDLQTMQQAYNAAQQRYTAETNPVTKAELAQKIQKYQADIKRTTELRDNPFYSHTLKDHYFHNQLDDQFRQMAEAQDNVQQGAWKMDEYQKDILNHSFELQKLNAEHEYKQQEQLYKTMLDQGYVKNPNYDASKPTSDTNTEFIESKNVKGKSTVDKLKEGVTKKIYLEAIKQGKKVVDANGNLLPVENLEGVSINGTDAKTMNQILTSLKKYTLGDVNDASKGVAENIIMQNYKDLGLDNKPNARDIQIVGDGKDKKIKIKDKEFTPDEIVNKLFTKNEEPDYSNLSASDINNSLNVGESLATPTKGTVR